MYLLDHIIDLLSSQNQSIVWGVLSTLVGYVIYQQHHFTKEMRDKWTDIMELIKENRRAHTENREQLNQLRQLVKEELVPVLRTVEKQMEKDLQVLDQLDRTVEEGKSDQRGWFSEVKDDLNQFRLEFRDILKLAMNGRGDKCEK